jgi:hypothetical protein
MCQRRLEDIVAFPNLDFGFARMINGLTATG